VGGDKLTELAIITLIEHWYPVYYGVPEIINTLALYPMPTRDHPVRRSKSGVPGIRLALWIAALIGIIIAIIMYNRQDSSVIEIVETLVKEETVIPEPEREVQPRVQRESPGPVMSVLDDTPVAPEQPLPALNESDQEVMDALSGVSTQGPGQAADCCGEFLDGCQPGSSAP
jgi:hypothetical protein